MVPRTWGGVGEPYPVPVFDDGGGARAQGSEYVRWTQDCLNRAMGARLPVDGVMSAAARSVLRSFQQRENLPVTGIAGPDTEEALRRACAGAAGGGGGGDDGPAADQAADQEWALEWGQEGEGETDQEGLGDLFGRIGSSLGSAYGKVADALGGASGSRIIDLTAQADKSARKGTRDPKKVYALVLHQMACCFKPKDPLRRFLSLKAHFAILEDGRILQLHPVSALLWASNGFNAGSVAVEFAGNFPSIRGQWWQGDKFGRNRPTAAQLEAGRYLVRYLVRTMGLTTVLAHRQSSNTRGNDPGPDIWYHVGQWAVDTLGLKDGGPGYKHPAGGAPIPPEWRTWGLKAKAGEIGTAWQGEASRGANAEAAWAGAPEGPWQSELSLASAIADPKSSAPGVYTIYKGGRRLYVGKAELLRRRLQQHLWCLRQMDVDPSAYAVKLTPMRGASAAQLQKVEAAVIAKWGRRKHGGQLTNLKARELEADLRGEVWN